MDRHGRYIVVRHPDRPTPYRNKWDGDLRLLSITTQPWLAELLEFRRRRDATVYVHRGVLPGKARPTIACEVRVASVAWENPDLPRVTFECVRTIDRRAAHQPKPREICYSGALDPFVGR